MFFASLSSSVKLRKLSSVQIPRKLNVSKSTILSILHRLDLRVEAQAGRINNPENYRVRNPPYGYRIQDGRLVLNKSEIRVCRLVLEHVKTIVHEN